MMLQFWCHYAKKNNTYKLNKINWHHHPHPTELSSKLANSGLFFIVYSDVKYKPQAKSSLIKSDFLTLMTLHFLSQ